MPIDFACETTAGRTLSMKSMRGKPALVMVETLPIAQQRQNKALQERLQQLWQQNQKLGQFCSVVPVLGVWDVTGMALVAKKALVKGYASQIGMELWFATDMVPLQAVRGSPDYSSLGVVSSEGNLVWCWRGPCPVDDLIGVLRGQIERTFPGQLPA